MKSGFALLAIFIILRGSDSTVLKALQRAGSITHSSGGAEVISFCNVFFFYVEPDHWSITEPEEKHDMIRRQNAIERNLS